MKKILLTTWMITGLIMAVIANDKDRVYVSDAIERAFHRDFIETSQVKWEKVKDAYIVQFVQANNSYTAYYTEDGEFKGVTESVSYQSLPAKLQDQLLKKYSTSNIHSVIKYRSPGNTRSFFIELSTGKKNLVVEADDHGIIRTVKSSKV